MKKYIQEHKYVLLVLYLPIYLIWFALVRAHGALDGGVLRVVSAAGRQDPVFAGIHSGVCALVPVFDHSWSL